MRTRVSFQLAPAPAPGPRRIAYGCSDLLNHELESELEKVPPAYCVPGPEILAGTERVEARLLVEAENGSLEIEDRLCISVRALSAAIQTERATVGAALERAKEAATEALPSPVAHRPVHAVLNGFRAITRGIATLPDRVVARSRDAARLLRTPEGRARLRLGLREPETLHAYEKAVALFVGTVGILLGLLVLHLVVTLAVPSIAASWRTGVLLFVYGYVSSLGAPLPWEPVLVAASIPLGLVVAIVVAVVAKVVAGYMVFFLGDEVNERMERRAARSPGFRRFLRASEAFARRFGVLAMAVFIATPGLPDAIALYVFGSLGMGLRRYLFGIALGALVLDVIVLLGVRALLPGI